MTEGAVLVGAKWAVAAITAHWFGMDKSIQVLLSLMALDILTGLIGGIATKDLNSTASAKGIAKKAGALIIILAVHMMTWIANDFPLPIDVGAVVAWFYVATEAISIIENCARLGVPIPPILLDWLKKAKTLQERKQEDAAAKAQIAQQAAVETAKEAVVTAKESKKATEQLIDTLPAVTPEPKP